MANIQGYHHVGLTVPNINQTREFFINVFKFQQIGEVPDYPACFLSDGTIMLTLWQAATPEQAIPFDRKNNIGLHHFALTVDSLDALKSFHHTLSSTEGVEIEFAPEPLGNSSTHHMMFYIPGGIRMELTAPGAK